MRNVTLFILFAAVTITCRSQNYYKFTNENSVLDFYRQYSSYTDPGEYAYLYKNMPDSLPELCGLIKAQFIHPYAELPKYKDVIPKERWKEMYRYSTVHSILKGLVAYDSRGLVNDRKPEDKLVLGCRDYAVLLASILKSRGIPARIRAGHATYIAPDFHISHVVCEVWNENEKRWMLVDPGMDLIDFDRETFDISNEAWTQMRNNKIDPNLFGIPGKYKGAISIVAKLCSDVAFVLGTEYTVYQYAPMLDYAFENEGQFTSEHIKILNRMSKLMSNLDAKNLTKLQKLYNKNPDIQITQSFTNIKQ